MSGLEWGAALLGLVAVWFTVKQKWWCWPLGIINVALYFFVFFQAKLYADMGLQVVYVVLQIYGWYMWLHGGDKRKGIKVSASSMRLLAMLTMATVLFSVALGLSLSKHTDAALPYWDSSIAGLSLAGQYLQSVKKIENWIIWGVVNVLSVGVFAFKGLYPTTALYAIFLVMSLLGWREWRVSLAAQLAV